MERTGPPLPLACPALRRLRLVACANCRGTLASDTQLPPPVASSDRRLSATSDGHFGEMTPVKGPDESDDELFAMDDERPERNVSFASPTSRRLAFAEPPREVFVVHEQQSRGAMQLHMLALQQPHDGHTYYLRCKYSK